MTPQIVNLPLLGTMAGFRRFTVDEYHRLIDLGILTEDDNVELIEGYLIRKMPRSPLHDGAIHRVLKRLGKVLPAGWDLRVQSALTLADSEPEPDLAIVRADPDDYTTCHPTAADAGLVIEVADSTLAGDRADKARIYARAGIECYWIINLVDRQVETYTSPSGAGGLPSYVGRQDYRPGDAVPLVLAGTAVASLAIQDLLP